MRLPRPCLDCQKLHTDKGDYCLSCRKERNRKKENNPERKARKKLLYNSNYRRAASLIKLTATHCHICKEPFTNREEITADHLLPGEVNSPLAPAHKSCNSARGNRGL